MRIRSSPMQNLSSICTFKCRLDTAVCNCIFGPKLSMIRIIIYTCTKESTRLHVLQHSNKVILWRSAASSGPQGQNWWQRPAPSLWLQLKGPGTSWGASQKKQQIFCRTFSTHNTYTSYLQQHMRWNSQLGAMRDGATLLRSQANFHWHQHLGFLHLQHNS